MYPLTVRVEKKRVVVIGGGKVGIQNYSFTQTRCRYSRGKS